MPFNSFSFWLVFPFIFGLYWLIPAKYSQARKVFLVLVSYLLYMNWKPAFTVVLLGVTLVTYGGGYLLDNQETNNKKKGLAWLFALLAVLPLLVFKYYNFLNDSLSQGLAAIGLKFALPRLNWAIPVGISFFTFQAVGYMLDVYHGKTKAEKNILVCWTYRIFQRCQPFECIWCKRLLKNAC
jgi:D-alanyl-lipoteichoic acid acyltransferase DltB (MBOAT superfamily)